MNSQGNQGYAPQQPGQQSYPSMNAQLPQQPYQVHQSPNSGLPQSYGGQINPNAPMQQMPQGQIPASYSPAISAPQQQGQPPAMSTPTSARSQQPNGGQGQQQQQQVAAAPLPEPVSKTIDGKRYELKVVQQPIRARMCGFGDKDRRPITPPPCVRLVIYDEKTGQECDASDFDTIFFILTVDLWDETGHKEVNLVRHSATSPSISAATSSSYPPPNNPVYPYTSNTTAQINSHSQQATATTGMQVHVGLTNPGYGPGGYGAHHAAPYIAQPPQQAPGAPAPAQFAQDPTQGSRGQDPQSYYVSPQGQPTGTAAFNGAYGPQPGMQGYGAPGMGNMLAPQHAAPMDPRSAPSGMFTRNLIGSLAVNANPLSDTHGKQGIWFILQDLSVRTEGSFRLKMQFCNVCDPVAKTLNRGTAPILAATYSDPFHVFSAKKFPGVIESTPLSKCFAMQGVKIPIRKDGPTGKAAEVDDDAGDGN